MKVGDRILYGEYKGQHIDEIEQVAKGYVGRYTANGATTDTFKTIEELVNSYVKSRYWLYVEVESQEGNKELKNLEKDLLNFGKPFLEEHFETNTEFINISLYKYCGETFYYKETIDRETNKKEILLKLVS